MFTSAYTTPLMTKKRWQKGYSRVNNTLDSNSLKDVDPITTEKIREATLNLRGGIHTHFATRNVIVTFLLKPTHPPRETSSAAREKLQILRRLWIPFIPPPPPPTPPPSFWDLNLILIIFPGLRFSAKKWIFWIFLKKRQQHMFNRLVDIVLMSLFFGPKTSKDIVENERGILSM